MNGAGGGGSGFLHPILLRDGETTTGNASKGDGSFKIEIANYASGTTYSGQYHSGSVDNIFDGSLDTNLDGVPNDFNIYFTNLPIPTTSLRFYLFQDFANPQVVECILKTGSYSDTEYITYSVSGGTPDLVDIGNGQVGNFLSISTGEPVFSMFLHSPFSFYSLLTLY